MGCEEVTVPAGHFSQQNVGDICGQLYCVGLQVGFIGLEDSKGRKHSNGKIKQSGRIWEETHKKRRGGGGGGKGGE